MRLLTAVAVTSLLLTPTARAATLYVSTTGNDAAAGSADAPLRTLTRAAVIAQPGDIVSVRGGTYTDRAVITSRGTAAAPIVFRAMPGETVVLDGATTPSNKGVVELIDTQHVDFSGFEVRNAPYIGIVLWHARNTRILDNHIHHTVRNGIYAGGDAMGTSSDITVSGNRVHDTVLENQYHNMNGGGWAGAVVVSKADRATITGNRIWNNDGEGIIALRANQYLVEGNEVFDNFSVNLYLDNARFVTVNANLIYSTGNTRYYRNGLPAAGISIANETKDVMNPSSDNLFTNNIVIGTRWGFHYGNYESGGGLRNTRVLHNTFYGTAAEIVRVEDDSHANSVIANNIFYQTGSATPRYAGAGAVTYRTNLWYGGSAGPAAGSGDITADPRLVNAGARSAGDYKLTALSPAIASGADLAPVAADFWGAARGPVLDVGAHQYSAGMAPLPDSEQPAIPANVTAAPSATTPAITLAWNASTDNVGVTGYKIHRNGSAVASVSNTSWTDTGLAFATLYHYTVSAVDAAGNESAPAAASATTMASEPLPVADTEAPSVPTGFWVSPSSSSAKMYLGWTASSDNVGVTGYRIHRDGHLVATITGLAWTDSGVAFATTYRYTVTALDAAGNESMAAAESATTIAGEPGPVPVADNVAPSMPAGFWVSPSSSSTRMYLGWSASADNVGVTAYRIYRNGSLVATITGLAWTDDSSLKKRTTYHYAVAAIDAAGNESAKALESARTSK